MAALTAPAYWYLAIVGATMLSILLDLMKYSGRRADVLRRNGLVPLWPSSIVPYVLSQRKYRLVFGFSVLAYGILYGFLTSLWTYRPDLDFANFPGLAIPSVQPDQLVGIPLYVPEVTVFLTNHVALVLIPLTVIMMAVISVLVGVNLALAVFAYDNRVKDGARSWGGQLGAVVGLFTGCPTCAGLYFFSLLGGSGAVSFAVALGYYQPLLILLSVPALLVSPYLISRSLSQVFRDGCVVVTQRSHHPS